jgi:DNA polymerase-4
VDAGPTIARVAKELLAAVDPSPGVRLLGVSVSGLTDDPTRQLTLDDVAVGSWDDASQAVDDIRRRFGDAAIGPASLAGADGLRIKRRGDQQWGPGQEGSDPQAPRRPADEEGTGRARSGGEQ